MTRLAVFDVGGTAIKYCAMEGTQIQLQGETPTPDPESHDPEPFLATLERIIAELGPVEGVALSVPGVVDVDARYLHTGGALTYNFNVDVTEWERRFGLPVEVENDARCSTMAELAVGNLQGVTNGAVLTFGTGIGGGAVVNGELFKGSHLYSGEASMMYFKTPRRDSELRDDGAWSTACSTTGMCRRLTEAKGIEECDGRQLFAWLEAGDEVTERVFRAVCDDIAIQIHNIQCWLDPERICLGGGISRNPLFIEGVRAAHRRFNAELLYAFPEVELETCKFFNEANLIGAYQHFVRMREKRGA
ncbi:ROK family protein [Olsenella sp. An285]|uniref:ROK family protein n=1 Tax=Olsenella sp. An285 TaxID=1965621 RepID=UPI0013020EED|nr:ROK family protein [Olsenella sp. An285]